MTDQAPTREELFSEMDAAWLELQAAIETLEPEHIAGPTDAGGWTVQDHLDHLAAWERSMVFLLQGKPRQQGLGIDEATYLGGDYDIINEAIRAATPDRTPAETLAYLAETHEQLRELVSGMSDSDLMNPYHHFLPDEPGDRTDAPIAFRIRGNSGDHYREHLGYIDVIVSERSGIRHDRP